MPRRECGAFFFLFLQVESNDGRTIQRLFLDWLKSLPPATGIELLSRRAQKTVQKGFRLRPRIVRLLSYGGSLDYDPSAIGIYQAAKGSDIGVTTFAARLLPGKPESFKLERQADLRRRSSGSRTPRWNSLLNSVRSSLDEAILLTFAPCLRGVWPKTKRTKEQ
jgi:hypothetical protein